jgi:hypothetical protein
MVFGDNPVSCESFVGDIPSSRMRSPMAWPTAAQSSFSGASSNGASSNGASSSKAIPPRSASAHRLADRGALPQVAVTLRRPGKEAFRAIVKNDWLTVNFDVRKRRRKVPERTLDNRRNKSRIVD